MPSPVHFLPRRQFCQLLGTALLGVLLPGCKSTNAAPLSLAIHKWPGYEFLFLAQREQQLDPNLVQLLETDSAPASIQALQEGRADAAALTLDEVLYTRSLGINVSAVLVFDISTGADMVLAKPPITDRSQIKHKRIGVEKNAVGALMLNQLLSTTGLTPQDITSVPLNRTEQEAAWQRNEIDILICYPPVSSRILQNNANKIFDSRELPNMIVDVLAVKQNVLASKQIAIEHAILTHFLQLNNLRLNPQDSSYRMAQHLNLPAEQVLQSFKGMELPDLRQNHQLLAGEKPLLKNSAQSLHEIMINAALISQPDKLSDLLRGDFLPQP